MRRLSYSEVVGLLYVICGFMAFFILTACGAGPTIEKQIECVNRVANPPNTSPSTFCAEYKTVGYRCFISRHWFATDTTVAYCVDELDCRKTCQDLRK